MVQHFLRVISGLYIYTVCVCIYKHIYIYTFWIKQICFYIYKYTYCACMCGLSKIDFTGGLLVWTKQGWHGKETADCTGLLAV